MGTVVFPDADVKVYLDADIATRAERRAAELRQRGEKVDIDRLRREVEERDRFDSNRRTAPLKREQHQTYLDTSALGIAEVVDRLEGLVRERIPDLVTSPEQGSGGTVVD